MVVFQNNILHAIVYVITLSCERKKKKREINQSRKQKGAMGNR